MYTIKKSDISTLIFEDNIIKVVSPIIINNVEIMPDIANVNVIRDADSEKAVIVTFADGSVEKAVLCNGDQFNLEYGISICITKKLLSQKSAFKSGTYLYNKIVKRGLKVYNNALREEHNAKVADELAKLKKAKLAQKKAAKRARREAARREREVSIQAEAYLRAMKEYGSYMSNEWLKSAGMECADEQK